MCAFAVITALVLGRLERGRILGALRDMVDVRFCERAEQIPETLGLGNVRVILTELHDSAGAPTAPIIRAVRAQFPSVSVLIYLRFAVPAVRELVALTETVAVSGVVFRDIDDAGAALRSTVRTAYGSMPAAVALEAIDGLVPARLRWFFTFCLGTAVAPITIEEVASSLGVPRRTLLERLGRAGLPGPRRIVNWCRLLHAAWLLGDTHRSVEEVAGLLSFASGPALHNLVRRYTGLPMSVVRAEGGFHAVLAVFVEELQRRVDDRAAVEG